MGDSHLNATCSLESFRHRWVALCNKIHESDFFPFFLRSSVVRVWEFFLKNSDKNKTEREYVSKLEF